MIYKSCPLDRGQFIDRFYYKDLTLFPSVLESVRYIEVYTLKGVRYIEILPYIVIYIYTCTYIYYIYSLIYIINNIIVYKSTVYESIYRVYILKERDIYTKTECMMHE